MLKIVCNLDNQFKSGVLQQPAKGGIGRRFTAPNDMDTYASNKQAAGPIPSKCLGSPMENSLKKMLDTIKGTLANTKFAKGPAKIIAN